MMSISIFELHITRKIERQTLVPCKKRYITAKVAKTVNSLWFVPFAILATFAVTQS